jgi:hypothetical protein
MKLIVLLILSFTVFTGVLAQPLSATVDRNKILIGEKLQLVLRAAAPKEKFISWKDIDTIPHFEIMQKGKVDSALNGDSLVLTQTYTLTSWDSGKWQFPRFDVKTKPITVYVGYTPFDVSRPYNDIKQILDVKRTEKTTWYWYLIGLALLIILFLLFFPAGKKKEKPAQKFDMGAYKKAKAEMEKLKREDLPSHDVKEYYVRLINIFRQYVYARWGIQSYSKTTDDLAVQIQSLNMPKQLYSELLQVLRLSDLVKFAKYQPLPADNDTAFAIISDSLTSIEHSNAV